MKREAMVLLLAGALAAPLTAQAQGRGGHAGGSGFHGMAVSRPAMPQFRFGTVRPPSPIYRGVFRPTAPVAVVPYYSPYYSPYNYGTPYGTAYPAPYTDAPVPVDSQQYNYNPNDAGSDVGDLSNQIQQLTAEVEQLRSDQAQRDSGAQPVTSSVSSASSGQSVPTILIFRDGHRMEINNYAVSGETLWVLTERSARQIPLADLDLNATQKANQDNGVRLLLPH